MVSLDPLRLGYVLVFGAAALACWVRAVRARAIDDEETRRGLVWLLLLSGGWAAAHVGYLMVRTPTLGVAFYQLGIVVGIAAVGPWLYFCSALPAGASTARPRFGGWRSPCSSGPTTAGASA